MLIHIPEKSRTRHIAYCRKSTSRFRSRKKSCSACTKAKTRCDLGQPSCSRCKGKNVVCVYQQNRPPEASADELPVPSDSQLTEREPLPPQHNTPKPLSELSSNRSAISDISTLVAFRPTTCPLHPLYRSNIDSVEIISSEQSTWGFGSPNTISHYLENIQDSQFPERPLSEIALLPRLDRETLGFQFPASVLYEDIVPKPPKYFWPSTIQHHRFSLNKQYLLCTLNSYPYMILPGRSFPPFIHQHLLVETSRDGGRTHKSQMPRPLASCAAIMQMFSAKNESNVKFIWSAIRMEQERMINEVSPHALKTGAQIFIDRSTWSMMPSPPLLLFKQSPSISWSAYQKTMMMLPILISHWFKRWQCVNLLPREKSLTKFTFSNSMLSCKQVNKSQKTKVVQAAVYRHGRIGFWESLYAGKPIFVTLTTRICTDGRHLTAQS